MPISFAVSLATVESVRRFSRANRLKAPDVYKGNVPKPKLGGVAVLASMILALALSWPGSLGAIAAAAVLSGIVGLVDDLVGLPAIARVLMPAAAAPLILAHVSQITLPFVGEIRDAYVVAAVAAMSVPVMANAVNMLDVANGIVPSSTLLIMATMAVVAILRGEWEAAWAALYIASSTAALYMYNRYPAKVFNGNVGSYTIGAAIGAYAVVYNMGFEVVLASMPYILNGLLIIASSRGLKSREKLARPTRIINGIVCPSREENAPLTLVRLIVVDGALDEKGLYREVVKLFVITCTIAAITSVIAR